MLDQILSCALVTHTIKNNIDAFTACQLGGRHEIGIGRDNYNLVDLALESQ